MSRRVRVILYSVVLLVLATVISTGGANKWLRDDPADQPTATAVRAGLEEFLAPWDEAVRHQSEQPATVVVVGDSISEGTFLPAPHHRNRFVGLLQDRLRESQGIEGGAGYLPAYYGDRLTVDDAVRSGPPSQEQMFSSWGLGGRALQMPAEAVLTYPEQTATSVRVWYGRTALSGGQGLVLVDGEDITDQGQLSTGEKSGATIDGASTNDESALWWTSPPLERGPHVVQVQSSAPNLSFLHTGVEFFDGDETSGIQVIDGSHSGASALHFASEYAERGHWQEVAAMDPDLILINLGSNPEADYASALGQTVVHALAAAPRARILLVDGYEPGTWDSDAWQAIRWARQDIAAQHPDRVRVFDLAAHWPKLAKDGSTSEGLMTEGNMPLHPNAEGNRRMADIFAELLVP